MLNEGFFFSSFLIRRFLLRSFVVCGWDTGRKLSVIEWGYSNSVKCLFVEVEIKKCDEFEELKMGILWERFPTFEERLMAFKVCSMNFQLEAN